MTPTEVLSAAWTAVAEAQLPEPIQATAFNRAIDLILQENHTVEAPAKKTNKHERSESSDGSAFDSPIEKLAAKLRLNQEVVDQVFITEDGAVRIGILRKKLATTDKAATEQLALLLTASRQATGVEEVTAGSEIRATVKEFGKLSAGNFAAYLGGMTDEFLVSGRAPSWTFKLNRHGWERAAELVQELAARGVES